MIQGAARKRRLRRSLNWRETVDGWLFILPWMIGFLFLVAGPMVASALISFTEWKILKPPEWIGLGNFIDLFKDGIFWVSLGNTVYYTFLGVPVYLIASFGMALVLNMKLRGMAIYRTIFFVPSLTPAVANALLWMWIFNPDFGLANVMLNSFGLPSQKWLFDPQLAKLCFIIMGMWGVGQQMVTFLAGLQGIPIELYEAASIDGANNWRRFWAITIPMVSPTIFFNLVIGIIGSFQVFTTAFIATQGGPQNATLFYVLYLYRNAFQYFKMGYASALAWVLFIIVLFFTLIQFRVARRLVYYESEEAK
jgi:multiple sugar transport system permease protein